MANPETPDRSLETLDPNEPYMGRNREGHDMAVERHQNLVDRLLDQNERLIELLGEAVRGSNPAAVLSALNPPYIQPPSSPAPDPYGADSDPRTAYVDPWGDDNIPAEAVIPGMGRWVETPGIEEAKAAAAKKDSGEQQVLEVGGNGSAPER